MIIGAEKLRSKYQFLNISDGPTFKIPNDPRYTKFGKYLAKSGLDELPQLINVLKGEMSFVGPRPLPTYEAIKLTKHQRVRELVLPGITSSWITNGAHRLKFKRWMQLDREYIENANLTTDLVIIFKTVMIILSIGIRKLFK
jgi:lipopolysaccharide/colanic/teichoic acid biosynthesis glycosyltransferase